MPVETESLICTVSCPLGDDVLQLVSMRGTESVSAPYQFQCTFMSEQADIDFDAMIGQNVCLKVGASEDKQRCVNGVVSRFSQSGADSSYATYQAELVPWLWLLTRSTDCRIWHGTSAPDIIKEVFDKLNLTDYDFNDLTGTYDPIPYCVQYRETDFNFVSRLMEDAGIGYYFKHETDHHTLVLFDSPDKNAECPSNPEASYVSEAGEEATAGIITEWYQEKELRSGAWAMTDYNYEDPSLDLGVSTTTSMAVGGNERFEVFDYPGEYMALQAGNDIATLRIEAEEAACQVIQGAGSCSGFMPGYKFDLRGHYREDFDGTYLITEVTHSLSQSVAGDGLGFSSYENSFACRPHSVPYRPLQVTPAPVIQGIHTATVVGEEGKEIDIDSYGSVLVHFPWDRDNKYSCRARVSQNWAGKEWGFFCAPRIGQEVLIQFVEGDPRRPIVVGRVYNAEQMPPYSNGEHSGIKSRSTPEGGAANFNEIRLEDKKGEELFYVHAEKDKEIQVENDRRMTIDNDDKVIVGNNRKVDVSEDHEEKIGGNETLAVEGDRTRTVTGIEMVTVDKDQEIIVSENRKVTVTEDQTNTISGGWTVNVTEDLEETIDGAYTETVANEYAVQAKTIDLVADEKVTLKTGDAEIVLESSGDITIKGAKIVIEGSGDVEVSGSKVKLN